MACSQAKLEAARRYYERNREKVNAANLAWHHANRDHHIERMKARKQRLRKHNAHVIAWTREQNKLKRKARNLANANRRRASKCPFADPKAIEQFYVNAKRLTEQTGVVHQVDHIVPLNGRKVSGLHNQFNLQVLPEAANRAKFNHFAVA